VAYSLVRRLRDSLIEGKTNLDLVDIADDLDSKLGDRISALTEAEGKAGATAESTTNDLLEELDKIKACKGTTGGGSGTSDDPLTPEENSFAAAITGSKSAAFRQITTMLSGLDMSTGTGQLDALTAGFDGDCVISLRVLLSPKAPTQLATRHDTLGTLLELRQYRLAYFNYQLRVTPGSGAIARRVEKYEFGTATDTVLLDALCSLTFHGTPWIPAPHGLMGLEQCKDGRGVPLMHDPRDYYCQPDLMLKLTKFLHVLTVSIGGAVTSATGYTWLTLGEFMSHHLQRALCQPTEVEVIAWLQRSSDTFANAILPAISSRLQSIMFLSARIADLSFNTHILPFDSDAIRPLANAESLLESIADRRAEETALSGLAPSGSNQHQLQHLPLLSKSGEKPTGKDPPPTKGQGKRRSGSPEWP